MGRGSDGSDLGRFSLQVPPPSANGSRTKQAPRWDIPRRAIPGAAVGTVVALSMVPRGVFLDPASLQAWPAAVAGFLAGVAAGIGVRRRGLPSAAAGACVGALALVIASIPVRIDAGFAGGVTGSIDDLLLLVVWGAGAGAIGGLAGGAAHRSRASTAKLLSR